MLGSSAAERTDTMPRAHTIRYKPRHVYTHCKVQIRHIPRSVYDTSYSDDLTHVTSTEHGRLYIISTCSAARYVCSTSVCASGNLVHQGTPGRLTSCDAMRGFGGRGGVGRLLQLAQLTPQLLYQCTHISLSCEHAHAHAHISLPGRTAVCNVHE